MESGDAGIATLGHAQGAEFRRRFVLITCGGLTVSTALGLATFAATEPEPVVVISIALLMASAIASFALAWFRQLLTAACVLLFLPSIVCTGSIAALGLTSDTIGALESLIVIAVLSPILLPTRWAAALVALDVALLLLAHLKLIVAGQGAPDDLVPQAVGTSLMISAATFSVAAFVRHANRNEEALRMRLRDIDNVMERARRIARGDLSGAVEAQGDVADVIAAMLEGLRGLVEQIQLNAARLAAASNEISAMAAQQEQSVLEQGSAIEETRRTIAALLAGSRDIASSAQGVASDADTTLRNAELISDRIQVLAAHTQRITDILEMIKDVANKSELLALNAALEGAKAGEAGRGFSLVASQMQRLAESVMASVKSVKELTADIREATNGTALATEDATKLASSTTQAAQRITLITERQQQSTEQVTRAVDEIAQATHQSAAGTNQTLQAVRELSLIADELNQYVGRFQLR